MPVWQVIGVASDIQGAYAYMVINRSLATDEEGPAGTVMAIEDR